MKRRRILAGVILLTAVVVAVPFGPEVWDWMTLRTVEQRWPGGTPRESYRIRLWDDEDRRRYVGTLRMWYENGQLSLEETRVHDGQIIREWSEQGQLVSCMLVRNGKFHAGVIRGEALGTECRSQDRYTDGSLVETRTSTPWFTEEEILRAVEGVAE